MPRYKRVLTYDVDPDEIIERLPAILAAALDNGAFLHIELWRPLDPAKASADPDVRDLADTDLRGPDGLRTDMSGTDGFRS